MTVSSSGQTVGGLAGSVHHINRSYATGSVSGTAQVGGLAGLGRDVTDSYATGNVSGTGIIVGGLVGWQSLGSISNSYATGSVGGTSEVGGLVGFSDQSGASIATSYASGAVTGSGNGVGGLAGTYWGTIANSYATGSASGASNVGGLVGELDGGSGAGTIANSYATGAVSASVANPGGLVGSVLNGATATNSYWDTVTTGQATSAGGAGAVGKTTAQLAAALPTGFSSATWGNAGNQTTPYLLGHSGFNTAGPTYLGSDGAVSPTAYGVILNVTQLQAMSNNLAGKYVLGNDIDASATATWNDNGAGGYYGFVPVGDLATKFTGSFDGLGHSISDLYINRPASTYVGLFGYADAASLRNVGLTNPNITGLGYVGSLAGYIAGGTTVSAAHADGGSVSANGQNVGGLIGVSGASTNAISASYATSTVTSTGGPNSYAGGLVGLLRGTLTNSYATGNVSGLNIVGGLVGENQAFGTVTNSYATGAVNGNADVGGLVGRGSGAVTASFWDTQTSGQATSAGGAGAVGKTTAEMKSLATFAGWDIDAVGGTGKVWRIYDGYTNPLLRGFLTSLNVQPDYDGSGAALTNVGAVTPVGAYDAGKVFTGSLFTDTLTLSSTAVDAYTATSTANNLYSNQQGYDLVSVARSIATPGSASGDIALTNPISWTSGTLAINTTGTVTQTAAINGTGTAIFDLQAGTWSQVNAALPGFSAYDFRISGGTFIRALSGDGTVGTPYQLADIYGMQGMGSSGMLGLNYALANDVDATGTANWWAGAGFVPVGPSFANRFTGSFDGQGHTITGLTIDRAGSDFVGLFGSSGGTLRDVTLSGVDVRGNDEVGGLVGDNSGAIEAVHVSGTVTGHYDVGGLAGYGTGSIAASAAAAVVAGTDSVGGLAGWLNSAGTIDGSHATGAVTGDTNVGGLVGYDSGTSVADSYATGAVTGTGTWAGGLVGFLSTGSVARSYATGAVSGGNQVGGLAGRIDNAASIADSYATGAVDGSNQIGGLAGSATTTSTIDRSYATGAVTGATDVGGLAGSVDGTSAVTASFYADTTGQSDTGKGDLKTTAEMMQLATFTGAGWDIDDAGGTGKVWRIYEGNGAPLLRGFMTALTVTANDATRIYDGLAYSGGNGVSYSTAPNANLLGTVSYGGTSQGATEIGGYVIAPSGFHSNQQGYDITYASGTLTIAAVPPAPTSGVPTVPGAPLDGYAGAVVSTGGGKTATAAPPLLALAQTDAQGDDEANGAGPALPGVPGFTIIPCGQALPPAIANGCQ